MTNYVTHPLVKAALIVAFILLVLANNIFAQTDSQQGENKIHIKISKDVDGKKTNIDTTFASEADVEMFMSQFNAGEDNEGNNMEMHFNDGNGKQQSFNFYMNEDSLSGDKNMYNLGFNAPGWSQVEREKFNAEMQQLQQELKKELGDFDFKMDTASAFNNFKYNFKFEMPDEKEMERMKQELKGQKFEMPPMPPICDEPNFDYKTEGLSEADKKKFDETMQKAEESYTKAMQFLKDNNGKIVMPPMPPMPPGCSGYNFNFENENAASKNQKRVIIIQKSDSKTNTSDANSKANIQEGKSKGFSITDFNYYPNPNNGKFDVSFSLPEKGDLQVTIMDTNGRTFYNENLQNFSGQYQQSFDLREQGAGVYFLKIAQGKDWMTKKLVIK